ncbi:MAG: hypothetical protein ABI835_19995 [Chloroflexota bacterium]
MATAHLLPLYDEFLDYLIEKASPAEILAFQPSEDAQEYARDLLERNSEGELTVEEKYQLAQMLQFERMMSVLKAKALAARKQS